MKKIYIAGKITGECETKELMDKCLLKFNTYGCSLLAFGMAKAPHSLFYRNIDSTIGFTHGFIINSELIQSGLGTWQQYMRNDIHIMLECDEVHMLPDWKESKGAKIEHQIALDLGIKIIYAN